jgi:hypothetical protein
MFEQTTATADLSSFKWTGDRTFEANLFCGEGTNCTQPLFRGNISALFTQ